MTPAARLQAAVEVVDEILKGSTIPADGIVAGYFKARRYVGAKDRRSILDSIYGVLRRRARLAWWLEKAGWPLQDGRAFVLADLAIHEAMSPEDVENLAGGPYGTMHLSAEERGLVGTLQGVSIFHHDMPVWVKSEYPEWVEPHLRQAFGDDLAAEMGAARDEAPFDLRVNLLKATRAEARAAMSQAKVTCHPTSLSPWGLRVRGRVALATLDPYRNGLVEVQDEGSQLVALIAGVQPNHAVVDFCAGAGGKTLALAALMQNKGRLVACDTHKVRIDRAKDRLRRAGVHNVTRRVLDSETDKWVKRSAGSFDRVLVDAPCTGTGTWRRNPDAKWKMTPTDIAELSVLQGRILDSASRLAKPGGRVIYATCSVLPEENEARAEAFLASHPDFRLIPVTEAWPEDAGTPCPVEGPYLRLSPARHGTDGFFAAIFERAKIADPAPEPEPEA